MPFYKSKKSEEKPMYPSQPSYPAQASAPAMLGPPQPGQGPSYMGAPMAPPPQQLYYGGQDTRGPPPAYSQEPPRYSEVPQQHSIPQQYHQQYAQQYHQQVPYSQATAQYQSYQPYQIAPNQTVVVPGGFDAGARFGYASASIPPPPPGCAPNAAQMAQMGGANVVITQRPSDFLTGGSDGGYTVW